MIVGQPHSLDLALCPAKHQTPLVIDANAVEALELALERLEADTSWRKPRRFSR